MKSFDCAIICSLTVNFLIRSNCTTKHWCLRCYSHSIVLIQLLLLILLVSSQFISFLKLMRTRWLILAIQSILSIKKLELLWFLFLVAWRTLVCHNAVSRLCILCRWLILIVDIYKLFKRLVLKKIALSLAIVGSIFIQIIWFIEFHSILHFYNILLIKPYSNIWTSYWLLRSSSHVLTFAKFLFWDWETWNKFRRCNLSNRWRIIFHCLLIFLIFISKVFSQPIKIFSTWQFFMKHSH
jgi:hypothetical protein